MNHRSQKIAGVVLASTMVVSLHAGGDPFKQAKEQFYSSDYIESIDAYEQAFERIKQEQVAPSDEEIRNAHMCYGQAHWAVGEYRKGCKEFDARLTDPSKKLEKPLTHEALQNIKDKTVLARAEYGLGDTFGFMKYLKALKDAGATVILLAQGPLKGMLSRSKECVDRVINGRDEMPDFDYDVYLMSMPGYTSKHGLVPIESHKDIPHFGAYIHPLEVLVGKWVKELQGSCPIGVCWAASKNPVPGGRVLDRDVPLKVLVKLSTIANHKLYSLQGGGRAPITQSEFEKLSEDEQKIREGDIVPDEYANAICCFDENFDKESGPFEDTVAVMQAIKLSGGEVVSVDTSVPNLAGAADIPTCMLMVYDSDSRWGERTPGASRKTNRFFKSVKEFWQKKKGDWSGPMHDVQEYLEEKVSGKEEK